MPKLHLPIRRPGARWLALGVAATVIALPGIAQADPLSDPGSVVTPGSVPAPVGGVVDQVTGQSSQSSGSTSSGSSAPQQQASTQDTSPQGTTSAPPTLPPQLQQLLDQLQSHSPNPACSAAIQADLTKLATDIPAFVQSVVDYLKGQLTSGSPPTPQQILTQLQGLLGQLQGGQQPGGAAGSSPTPDPTVIAADLQQLVTDLTTKCLTAPTPPSSSSNPPPSNPQPPAQGVSQPQPAQPVSYPGYAPTGTIALHPASDQRSSDPVPLSVLAAVLLASSATAVGVRSRARRSGR